MITTLKERKIAITRAQKIISDVRKYLKKNFPGKYRFDHLLVGSAKYNAVVKDERGVYDMDYQFHLTHNCKCFEATEIRNDFFNAFYGVQNHNEKVENSTSVITVRVSNTEDEFDADYEIFSFDFASIIDDENYGYIDRRSENNVYVWNQLPSKNSYIYEKFYDYDYEDQKVIIDNVIERKVKEKKKLKNLRIPSTVIFMEEVNNYEG